MNQASLMTHYSGDGITGVLKGFLIHFQDLQVMSLTFFATLYEEGHQYNLVNAYRSAI